MRGRLLEVLPLLAREYNILPWHIDPHPGELTESEMDVFARDINRRNEQQRRMAQKQKRRR